MSNCWDIVLTTPAQELLQFLLYILYLFGQFTESYMKNNIIMSIYKYTSVMYSQCRDVIRDASISVDEAVVFRWICHVKEW